MTGPDLNQYTVNLTNVSNVQYLTVTLDSVQDVAGNSGNVVGPQMGVLAGDSTGNGQSIRRIFPRRSLNPARSVTSSNFRTDVTVNGAINSSDISLVKSKSGTALP